MKTRLGYTDDNVNTLTLSGVSLIDMDDVDAWLYAIDMTAKERKDACRKILTDGRYDVSNIEHRVTFLFKQ